MPNRASVAMGKPGELPPLAVEIRSRVTGELRRTIELDDPRVAFCEEFNRINGNREWVAAPQPDSCTT